MATSFGSNGPNVGGLTPGSSQIGATHGDANKEADDGTCVGAVDTDGNILVRQCQMSNVLNFPNEHVITTPWFMTDKAFRVRLESITDHQAELYYHDDVDVECSVCETAAPTVLDSIALESISQ